MKFTIERMKPEDVGQAAVIEADNFSIPWSANAFLEAMEKDDNIYVVAKSEGRVVGYIGSWSLYDEVNITTVCVAEEYRRNGIAKKMMAYLLDEGIKEERRTFILEVRVSNLAAIALYESMGFEKMGIRKNLYELPCEDGIVMVYTKKQTGKDFHEITEPDTV